MALIIKNRPVVTHKVIPAKKELPNKLINQKELVEGLQQSFQKSDGKPVTLHSVLTSKDFWVTNGKVKRTILTHDAVKHLADLAGVLKNYKNTILTQPDAYNNYQYTWQVEVCTKKGECSVGIGEANRSNLGAKGRGNPANMAEKRAYDRAVLRLLGITGLLSEEELPDEETPDKMEGLTHEEKKKIAPIVNQLILAKESKQLIAFGNEMKSKSKTLNPAQLDYLRKLYKKKVAEITKDKF